MNNSIKVKNMESPQTGRLVANQYIITDDGTKYFQSYNSVIVKINYHPSNVMTPPVIILDEKYWNYSRTTSKYRNQFLNETTKETKAKIKSGEYKLANLN